MPSVSILVTAFNREAYLANTLESILGSTYQDFEVIVVDDCSADGSLDIAQQIAEQDHRVQVYSNEQNLGDYANRMKAASLARGLYIKYVDSDDLMYPHSLAFMIESMECYPNATLGLSHSIPDDSSPYPWCLSPEQVYRKHFLGRGCLSCGPTGAIIRRDAFEVVGGFRKQWTVTSDIDLWFRLAARNPIVLFPPGLVWWRRHEEQEFTKDGADMAYLQLGYELVKDALHDSVCPLSMSDSNIALKRARQHFARRLLSLAFRRHQFGSAIRMFRETDLTISDMIKGLGSYQ